MKVCISEFTFKAFKKLFNDSLKSHELILIDSSGDLVRGKGKPDITFASYEVMFKCLNDGAYRKRFFYPAPELSQCDSFILLHI